MKDNANNLDITLTIGDQLFVLGNGFNDVVYDDSTSGGNVVTLGQGADDAILDYSFGGHDVLTLGNGDNASGLDLSIAGGDVITVGNGVLSGAYDLGYGGGDTLRVGNGNGANSADGGAAGGDTMIVGNGDGDNVYDWGGAARDVISLGHGTGDAVSIASGFDWSLAVIEISAANLEVFGPYHSVMGVATVTFAGPDAMLNLGYDRAASFASPITTQTSVSTTPLNIVHGLIAGDQIVLTGDTSNTDTLAGSTATNLAGVAGEAVFATGTFNAASDTFTYSATGHDALLTFDGQDGSNDFISVVLVGAAHEISGSSLSAGTLTLG